MRAESRDTGKTAERGRRLEISSRPMECFKKGMFVLTFRTGGIQAGVEGAGYCCLAPSRRRGEQAG